MTHSLPPRSNRLGSRMQWAIAPMIEAPDPAPRLSAARARAVTRPGAAPAGTCRAARARVLERQCVAVGAQRGPGLSRMGPVHAARVPSNGLRRGPASAGIGAGAIGFLFLQGRARSSMGVGGS